MLWAACLFYILCVPVEDSQWVHTAQQLVSLDTPAQVSLPPSCCQLLEFFV